MEIRINNNAFIITGGPGMGKTAIINQLSHIGYAIIGETGRKIIRHQQNVKGQKLPWGDRQGYAREMFLAELHNFKEALKNDTHTFFDRGIPDIIGYLQLSKLPIARELWSAVNQHRYHKTVFITPPWQQIYRNDSERKQSFSQAVSTYEIMFKVYSDLGYTLVEIPKLSVQQRAAFILHVLDLKTSFPLKR